MRTHKKKILIIGHKNPDTDSVCSAIAYATLKNKISNELHVARVAGDINPETEFALNYFGVDKPDYIDDVSTQVKDIDVNEVEAIKPLTSLKEAWIKMREGSLYTLPICNDIGELDGLITNSDIAHVMLDLNNSDLLSSSDTPYINICGAIDAQVITGEIENKNFETGKVVIANDNPDVMEEYIEEGDIVVLGNRYESQLCAIEMKAACIIVCENAKVAKTIQKIAEVNGCIIMVSPYDTFTVAKLINQAVPVKSFMTTENMLTFRTDAFIDEIKGIMAKKRFRDFPVLDHKGIYRGMISRRNLFNMPKKRIILVDHNELEQAVDGVGDAEILEIVDHHKLGTLTTRNPMIFRNLPLGCTATIIYGIFGENNVEIDRVTAGLLVSAIISDTLLFRSPTCTERDKEVATKLAEIAEIDLEKYAQEMFLAGSMLSHKSAEEIFYQDYKKFTIDDLSMGVSQLISINAEELADVEGKIKDYITTLDRSKSVDMLFFLLTDITNTSTKVLFTGDKAKDLIEEAFGVSAENKEAMLAGVVSRKKQFIPALLVAMQN